MQRFTPFLFIPISIFNFKKVRLPLHGTRQNKKIKRKNVEIFRVRSSITISNTYHQTRSQSTITPNQNIFQRQVSFFLFFVKNYRIFDQNGNFDPFSLWRTSFFICLILIFHVTAFVMQVSRDEMELDMIRRKKKRKNNLAIWFHLFVAGISSLLLLLLRKLTSNATQ